MVPKRMEASCFAVPAPEGLSSASSSSSSELSRTDQSSSSAGLARVRLDGWTGSGKVVCCLATSWLERRWKGLVSRFSASGLVTGGVLAAACWPMLRKKGFLDCSGGLETVEDADDSTGGLLTSGMGGGGGAEKGASAAVTAGGDPTSRPAGVEAASSSLSSSSSSRLSSWRLNSSSRFFASSTCALCAASRDSFSLASSFAACLARFSSAFFALPALTLSSSARRFDSASSRCCWSSCSCLASSFLRLY